MINNEIFERVAHALLADYSSVFYVDTVTGEYFRYSADPLHHTLRLDHKGKNFFEESAEIARKIVYEDDLEIFMRNIHRETMLDNIRSEKKNGIEYRLIIDGKPVWHTVRIIRGMNDGKDDYFVFGIINIDKEVRERRKYENQKKEHEVYDRIAEGLASNYDVIYYVDMDTDAYSGYTTNSIYGELCVREEGKDFFAEMRRNIGIIVHPSDRDRVSDVLGKNNIIAQLYRRKTFSIDYRLIIDGKTRYTRFTVMWAGDRKHILICVENIDSEIHREKAYIKALNSEKELARRDDLTGTKNKTAYLELINSVQDNINNGINYLTFAIVVCDINGLKQINDSEGHMAGDEYIKSCAKLICDIFAHSPVFRIGGDEFVVFVRGGDYAFKGSLFDRLRREVLKNRGDRGKPVIASGMSAYDPAVDKNVTEVFERADSMMYANKRELKGQEPR